MSAWESPVRVQSGPPVLPRAKIGDEGPAPPTVWEEFWSNWLPWEFPGQNLRPPAPMQKGKPQPPPQTAPTGPIDAAKKALGVDPASWQTFIRQTLADWGVYAGLGVLGLLGLVFLVSAAGGKSEIQVVQIAERKIKSGKQYSFRKPKKEVSPGA